MIFYENCQFDSLLCMIAGEWSVFGTKQTNPVFNTVYYGIHLTIHEKTYTILWRLHTRYKQLCIVEMSKNMCFTIKTSEMDWTMYILYMYAYSKMISTTFLWVFCTQYENWTTVTSFSYPWNFQGISKRYVMSLSFHFLVQWKMGFEIRLHSMNDSSLISPPFILQNEYLCEL